METEKWNLIKEFFYGAQRISWEYQIYQDHQYWLINLFKERLFIWTYSCPAACIEKSKVFLGFAQLMVMLFCAFVWDRQKHTGPDGLILNRYETWSCLFFVLVKQEEKNRLVWGWFFSSIWPTMSRVSHSLIPFDLST